VPQENLSWYSVLTIFHRVTMLLSADSMAILCTRNCWYWTSIAGVIWKCNRGLVFL